MPYMCISPRCHMSVSGPLGLSVEPLFSLYSPHGPVYRSMLRVVPASSSLKGGSRGSYNRSSRRRRSNDSWSSNDGSSSSSSSSSITDSTSSKTISTSKPTENISQGMDALPLEEEKESKQQQKRYSLAHNSGFTAHCSRCGQGAVVSWADLGHASPGCRCANKDEEEEKQPPTNSEVVLPPARCTVSS